MTPSRLFDSADTSEFGHANKSGVYAVCVNHYRYDVPNSKERILYIGSSSNVRKRLVSLNHPYRLLFNRLEGMLVYTRVIYCEDYLDLERMLISVYKPLLNKQHKRK